LLRVPAGPGAAVASATAVRKQLWGTMLRVGRRGSVRGGHMVALAKQRARPLQRESWGPLRPIAGPA